MAEARFRFKPRFVGLVALAGGLGLASVLLAIGGVLGPATELGLVLGAIGGALPPLYAASPAWRMEVVVGDDALSVVRGRKVRLALPWTEVVKVVWSPSTDTMFVDGGGPARSLLVPGQGATAPYDLEDKPALCRAILARVPAERVTEVESLERYATTARPPS